MYKKSDIELIFFALLAITDRPLTQTKGLTKAAGGDRGTIYAMAPEQLDSEQQHVTFKADVWSFGCLLIELFHPQHTQPYSKFKTQAIAFQICSGKQPPEVRCHVACLCNSYPLARFMT